MSEDEKKLLEFRIAKQEEEIAFLRQSIADLTKSYSENDYDDGYNDEDGYDDEDDHDGYNDEDGYEDEDNNESDDSNRPSFEENLVFVIMPMIGEEADKLFRIIKQECSKIGLNAERADDYLGSSLIINDIVELLKDCEFIICDVSQERPNVYYELGYAHGMEMSHDSIFVMAKEGTKIHFDLSAFRIHFYYSFDNLRTLLRRKFAETVKVARENY